MNAVRLPTLPRFAAAGVLNAMTAYEAPYWGEGAPQPVFEHAEQRTTGSKHDVLDRYALEMLREAVQSDLAAHVDAEGRSAGPKDKGSFDRALAHSLGAHLPLSLVDASDQGIWNFLALLVLPDVIWWRHRFSEARYLTRRNHLRVAWERQRVLGDLLHEGARPLGEDELVGLLERSRMARNVRLTRALARRILASEDGNRSAYARRLNIEVSKVTGTILLDSLDDGALNDIVSEAAKRIDVVC